MHPTGISKSLLRTIPSPATEAIPPAEETSCYAAVLKAASSGPVFSAASVAATANCELPGRTEKLCLSCGADLAISEQLTIEIDAAALSGRETENLVAEFTQLSQRLLERAQSM